MTRRRWTLAVALMGAGCLARDDAATATSAVTIPGPWVAPASTRAIAASQHVPVVDPPAVSPLGRCASTNPFLCSCAHPACSAAYPGTRELDAFLRRRYPFLHPSGVYCCRQNSAATRVPMLSVHALGRAIDLGVTPIGGDADNTFGDAVANWLVENAESIGVQRVIWDRAFWNGERGFGLLSSASLPHTDHIHVELSIAGANRATPFFTSGASTGTDCTSRCDGTRAIGPDCSSLDCAGLGAPCVAGPPAHCGPVTPTEPAESTRVASATIPSVRAAAAPGRYTPVGPSRVFDTRTPAASARLTRSGAAGAVTPSSNGTVRDWSGLGLPSGATGVWLNVAAIGQGAAGYATVFSAGQPRPPTSTVNYLSDAPNANATPAVLGEGGGVVFEAFNPAHLIADVYGAFSPTGAGLAPAGPVRVLDTRADAPLAAGVARAVEVSAPAGAVGVVATVAVVAGASPGFVTAYPCGAALPETSSLNFAAGDVVSNTVVSALGAGQLCLRANVEAHAIVDVTGYLTPSSGLTYTALTPQRLLDTRDATSLYTGRLAARQVLELPVQRMPGMPERAAAVVANLTAVSASGPGFVTAFPCGAAVPGTSSLTFPAERAVGALTVSALGGGSLCVFSNVRAHLIVDVLGVWTGAAPPVTTPPSGDEGDDLPSDTPDAAATPGDATATRDAVTSADDGGADPGDAAISAGDAAMSAGDAASRDSTALRREAGDDSGGVALAPAGCGCRAHGARGESSWLAAAVSALVAARRRRRGRGSPGARLRRGAVLARGRGSVPHVEGPKLGAARGHHERRQAAVR